MKEYWSAPFHSFTFSLSHCICTTTLSLSLKLNGSKTNWFGPRLAVISQIQILRDFISIVHSTTGKHTIFKIQTIKLDMVLFFYPVPVWVFFWVLLSSLCVSPLTDWQPVQGVRRLSGQCHLSSALAPNLRPSRINRYSKWMDSTHSMPSRYVLVLRLNQGNKQNQYSLLGLNKKLMMDRKHNNIAVFPVSYKACSVTARESAVCRFSQWISQSEN